MNIETRKMSDDDCKTVYTLNTWTDDKKNEARKLLEKGYWVRFASSCIGHTRARMVERDGLEWAKAEYIGILRIAQRDGYGEIYCRLI